MQKATKLIIALVVVIMIVGGVVWLVAAKKANSPSPHNPSVNDTGNSSATITYDGSSFEPNTITIKKGQSVKIVNQSSNAPLSFDSNPHPVHTDNTELNAGSIDPGVSKTITINKVGTWGYHNHLNPSQGGKIIVTN